MLYEQLINRPNPYQPFQKYAFATQLLFKVGDAFAQLRGANPAGGEDLVERITLPRTIVRRDNTVFAPLELFTEGLFTYYTLSEDAIDIERSGCVVHLPFDGKFAYLDEDVVMASVNPVISQMNLAFLWDGDTCEVIVESQQNGPRKLTPAEERLPYAKYYHRYFEKPFHERSDFKSWAAKAGIYAGNNMADPARMLHISDVNKLMDEGFRKNEWNIGWTLFDDGTGVMCARTEFPGTTAEAFKWWFAWHVKEDIRYMLWCPPSHYGISPSLELMRRITNPDLTLEQKTHEKDFGVAIHHVYEACDIDALSLPNAAPLGCFDIDFHDYEYRGFTKENAEIIANSNKITAVLGSSVMLHFFVEDEDGPGKSVLYSHFWYGHDHRDEKGLWHGSMNGKNYMLISPIMTIAQHCNKEFPLLADILPELFAEEGNKPI